MTLDPVLAVRSVGKLYARRSSVSRNRLQGVLRRALFGGGSAEAPTLAKHEFWAVRDVSFTLPRGKALGIIGLNGSGKTTLLRMLAGQILPDAGEIEINGSSGAMIDLTAGFQMSASGRENIRLKSAAMGWDKAQAAAATDEIIAFSELGDAIDAPVASYSAGMTMRLAFSIVSCVAPDLMLIDEILGVGDFKFREKCLGRIQSLREQSSFVLVSHSMSDVMRFCDEAIYVEKGRIVFQGEPKQAIAHYRNAEQGTQVVENVKKAKVRNELIREDWIEIHEIKWLDRNNNGTLTVEFGNSIRFFIRFTSFVEAKKLQVGLSIWTLSDQMLTAFSTETIDHGIDGKSNQTYEVMFEMESSGLNPGEYQPALSIVDGARYLYRKEIERLNISANSIPSWGFFTPPYSVDFRIVG